MSAPVPLDRDARSQDDYHALGEWGGPRPPADPAAARKAQELGRALERHVREALGGESLLCDLALLSALEVSRASRGGQRHLRGNQRHPSDVETSSIHGRAP